MLPVLILTRPAEASARMAPDYAGLAEVIVSPLLRIVEQTLFRPDPPPSALILTSAEGARAAARLSLLPGFPAWCVGASTAEAATRAGLTPSVAEGDAEALVALILASRPQGTLLHLRGAHVTGDVAARLRAAGLTVAEQVGYDQQAQPLTPEGRAALMGTRPVILPLFSPRTVSVLAEQGPFAAPLHLVALSPQVARAADGLAAVSLRIAARPDSASLHVQTLAALTGANSAGPAA